MKVCIVGAGAVGGIIGTRLAVAGAEVSALAAARHCRPAHARLALEAGRTLSTGRRGAVERCARAGAAGSRGRCRQGNRDDVRGPAIPPLLGPDTDRAAGDERRAVVVHAGSRLPARALPRSIRAARSPRRSRCVTSSAASSISVPRPRAPGVVVHKNGMGLIVGEPDGSSSPRLAAVHDAAGAAAST
jgi:2-dehydropantoate 2-reductase